MYIMHSFFNLVRVKLTIPPVHSSGDNKNNHIPLDLIARGQVPFHLYYQTQLPILHVLFRKLHRQFEITSAIPRGALDVLYHLFDSVSCCLPMRIAVYFLDVWRWGYSWFLESGKSSGILGWGEVGSHKIIFASMHLHRDGKIQPLEVGIYVASWFRRNYPILWIINKQ
jgi:hypothetical protein